jgi:hypothetical protein
MPFCPAQIDGWLYFSYHPNGLHQGIPERYAAAGDDELFLPGERAGAVAVSVPPALATLVDMVEHAPFEAIPDLVVGRLQAGEATPAELVAAALLAVNRSTELVSDHHGGAVHPTAGGWAVLELIRLLSANPRGNAGGGLHWAELVATQCASQANRHIQVSQGH